MKASCDKEYKVTETQQDYVPSLIEMGPLFPSLHVNEAGKTGLMSNRLALHEQFTVSPQRFAQLSAPCRPSAACSEECVLKECHHLPPSHVPVAPLSSKAQGFACSFFGTTDDTAVCDAGSNTLLDTVAMPTKGDNLKHIATKTADAPLPTNHTTLDKAESNDGQGVCHTPTADVMKLVKGAQYLSIGDGLHSVSDLKQAGLTPKSEGYAHVGCENAETGGKVIAKDEVLLTVSKQDQDTSCKEHDRRTTRALSSECCSQQVESIRIKNVPQAKGSDTEGVPFDRPMSNDVEVPGPCNAEGHMVTIEDDLEHGKENSPDARCARDSLIESSSICKIEVETALPSSDADVSTKPLVGFPSIVDASNRENTDKSAREMPARNKCRACGESPNKNNCHCGVPESSQEDIEMGNSLNDSESCWALSLSPKTTIQALGQLRFWKARLALIRQQRVFSDQVFELHKLIEVQRLLAGTPHTSIDEIYFGVGNMNLECDADALTSRSVDKKENVGDAFGKQIVVSKQVVGEAKTKSINSQAHLKQCPAVPGVVEGGVSVWGYPSPGVRHWTGSLPAAGAFPYPPLAGSFTFGSAVDGPFAAAPILGPEGAAMIRSPLFPFSLPFASQKSHLTPNVRTSYGPAIASSHQQCPAPYHKSSSGQEGASHSGPTTLNKTYCGSECPTASASQQRVKVQLGSKGLTVSGSKAEDLQYTVMGLKVNSSTARPANKLWQCAEHNEQGPSQALHMKHHEYDPEKMESLIKEVRGKRQKERKQQDALATDKEVDVNNSLNLSLNALDLFPLAPMLSLDEHSKRRPSGGAKNGRGML